MAKDRCQKFDILDTFWYLAFKTTQTKVFVNIDVCVKNVWFSNLREKTKENIIDLPD